MAEAAIHYAPEATNPPGRLALTEHPRCGVQPAQGGSFCSVHREDVTCKKCLVEIAHLRLVESIVGDQGNDPKPGL